MGIASEPRWMVVNKQDCGHGRGILSCQWVPALSAGLSQPHLVFDHQYPHVVTLWVLRWADG
jgi:hypothetical protein